LAVRDLSAVSRLPGNRLNEKQARRQAKLVSFKPIRLAQRALQAFTDRIVTVADKRVGKPLAEKKGTFDARASDEKGSALSATRRKVNLSKEPWANATSLQRVRRSFTVMNSSAGAFGISYA